MLRNLLARTFSHSRRLWIFWILLPWLITLLIPATRTLLIVQVFGSSVFNEARYEWTPLWEREAFTLDKLADKYPQDLAVQVQVAETSHDWKTVVQRYDEIIKSHPKESWLLARRLGATAAWLQDNRTAGVLLPVRHRIVAPPPLSPAEGDGYFPPSPLGDGSPAHGVVTKPPPLWELNKAVALARRGQKQEPNNSFYDWMLAYFLFAAERDEEAMSTLLAAQHKTIFEDYARQNILARIKTLEKVRPLLLEEKIQSWDRWFHGDGDIDTAPYSERLYQTARLATWQAYQAERDGQHQRALSIYAALTRLSTPLLTSFPTGAWDATQIQIIAWRGGGRPPSATEKLRPKPQKNSSVIAHRKWQYLRDAERFSAYAERHEAKHLASEVHSHVRQAKAEFPFLSEYRRSYRHNLSIVLPQDATVLPTTFYWGNFVILIMAACLIGGWTFLFFALWTPQLKSEPVQRRDLILAGAGYGVLGWAIIAAMAYFAANWFMWEPTFSGSDESRDVIFLIGSAVFLWGLAPLHLNALLCAGVTAWRQRKLRREVSAQRRKEYSRIGMPNWKGAGVALFFPLVYATTWILAVVGWLTLLWIIVAEPTGSFSWQIPIFPGLPPYDWTWNWSTPDELILACIYLTALGYIGWLLQWRYFSPPAARPLGHYAVRWFHRNLAVGALVLSWTYLLLALAVLPARREAEVRLNHFLRAEQVKVRPS